MAALIALARQWPLSFGRVAPLARPRGPCDPRPWSMCCFSVLTSVLQSTYDETNPGLPAIAADRPAASGPHAARTPPYLVQTDRTALRARHAADARTSAVPAASGRPAAVSPSPLS